MSKRIIGLLVASLFFTTCLFIGNTQADSEQLSGTITISGAWALYPMAVKWAEEFQKIYPKIKIDISAGGAGKGMVDCLAKVVDIGMVSREIYPEEINKGAWWVAVTKDAVVPTINEHNPAAKDILIKGIKRDVLAGIWITGKIKTWGEAGNYNLHQPIGVYTRSDACGAAEIWAKYLGKKQEDLLGLGVYGDPGLAEAVKKDNLGIGYNNINYVYDNKTKKQVQGISVLPIDINGNGQIDKAEDFYQTRDEITQAIADGLYPSPPARELYFVSGGKPQRQAVVVFMKWVLSDGQKYVPESGYISLSPKTLQEGIKKLTP